MISAIVLVLVFVLIARESGMEEPFVVFGRLLFLATVVNWVPTYGLLKLFYRGSVHTDYFTVMDSRFGLCNGKDA
ncbi:MAG: hypothetical protein O2954_15655 [bacterium]|nr:hypothetical protein [bacterium]